MLASLLLALSSSVAQQPQRPQAQTGSIAGSVADATTGAPVRADLSIQRPPRAVRADSTGRFVVTALPPGRVTLHVRAFSYQPLDTTLTVVGGEVTTIAIRLRLAPRSLDPVRTVAKSPERVRFEETVTPSVVSISGADARRVPAIGETDLLRTVALLPGVIARNDFSAGFNVRGGEADQNLVLLDGIPIYNPFHLGGLFGTFIDKAVGSVDVLTGAFPAQYGGRLSSVLDVRSLEETRPGAHGSAEVSLLSSSAFMGGALARGKLSWNLAARRTYADKVVEWIRGSNDFPYHFQDAQLRARMLLPRSGTLAITAYAGKDLLYHVPEPDSDGGNGPIGLPGGFDDDDDEETVYFDWGNRVAGLALEQPLGARTHLTQRVAYARFSTHFEVPAESVFLAQSVDEVQLAGSLRHARDRHTLTVGYEASRYRTSYRERLRIGTGIEFPDPLATDGDTTMRQAPAAGAVYADDLWKPNERLMLRAGVRAEYVSGADWLGISPRISAKYFLTPRLAISAAGGRYAQWMRAVRNEDLPLRLYDLWIASDENVPVSTSTHLVLGAERWFSDTRFLRVEGYGKTYDRLAEPASTVDPRIRPSLLRYFEGRSYGIDVYLRQLERNGVGGWIAYSYGVSGRERGGRSYFPAHDRRHNANIVLTRAKPDSRWAFGTHLGVATGTPYTGWAGVMDRLQYDPLTGGWIGVRQNNEVVRGPRNGERYPLYWRLDLSAERRFEVGGASVRPYFNIVNVFNRKNILLYTLDPDEDPPEITGFSQFPLLPSFGLRVEF